MRVKEPFDFEAGDTRAGKIGKIHLSKGDAIEYLRYGAEVFGAKSGAWR